MIAKRIANPYITLNATDDANLSKTFFFFKKLVLLKVLKFDRLDPL